MRKKQILLIFVILILLAAAGWYSMKKTGGKDFAKEKKYTYQELVEMPAEELYQLFVKQGLEIPEGFDHWSDEDAAEFLKSHFEMLHLGICALSYTGYKEITDQVKEIYDRIAYPYDVRVSEIVNKDDSNEEVGYSLEFDVDKIQLSEITGQVNEAKEIIAEQYADVEPWSSFSPGFWIKEFSSFSEAKEYIGLEKIRGIKWDFDEQDTVLTVYGNEKGEFEYLSLETLYQEGEIRLQSVVSIYTELYEERKMTRRKPERFEVV